MSDQIWCWIRVFLHMSDLDLVKMGWNIHFQRQYSTTCSGCYFVTVKYGTGTVLVDD
jgi:hypothetical protein